MSEEKYTPEKDLYLLRLRVSSMAEIYKTRFLPEDFLDFKQDVCAKIARYSQSAQFDTDFHYSNWLNFFIPKFLFNSYRNFSTKKELRRNKLKFIGLEAIADLESKDNDVEKLYDFDAMAGEYIKKYKEKYPVRANRDLELIRDYGEKIYNQERDVCSLAAKYKMTRRNMHVIIKKFKNLIKNEL